MTDSLFIASDHAGFTLKEALTTHLRQAGWGVTDLGTDSGASCDYPDFAHALCARVLETAGLGILICGTGLGMSMAANRHPGIRAAMCTHEFQASAARSHNNANVLCLGARVVGAGLALELADAFLAAAFDGERHARRVAQLDAMDN